MSMEILTAAIAAGETKSFMVNGQYLELIDAQYPCDVLMQDRQGGMVGTLKGAEVSFFSRPKQPFGQLQITSAQAQVVRFFIGDGDAGTRRISSTVQVIDGNRSRVTSGVAQAWRPFVAASAGNVSMAQLFNPAASGRRLIVDALQLSASGTCNVAVGMSQTQQATTSPTQPNNMFQGGPLTAMVACTAYAATVPGVNWHGSFALPANSNVLLSMPRPFVVNPGWGLNIALDVVNLGLTGFVQYFEEAI